MRLSIQIMGSDRLIYLTAPSLTRANKGDETCPYQVNPLSSDDPFTGWRMLDYTIGKGEFGTFVMGDDSSVWAVRLGDERRTEGLKLDETFVSVEYARVAWFVGSNMKRH